MRRLILFFAICLVAPLYGQEEENYLFTIYLTDSSFAPPFVNVQGHMEYSGADQSMAAFFEPYFITKWERLLPSSDDAYFMTVYTLETTDPDLPAHMLSVFSSVFRKFEKASPIKLLYYPDDYGATDPANPSYPIHREDLDYINTKKAWDITTGIDMATNVPVAIGMSDGLVISTNPELSGKTTYFMPSASSAYSNLHGTHTSGIAAAQGDNGIGSTGVCYDCTIVNTAYNYDAILALGTSGLVKVISMSWAEEYKSEVRQAVIDTIYNHGVVLVAGAGNSPSTQTVEDFYCPPCHYNSITSKWEPNVTGIRNFYPASYNHVISVSGINHFSPLVPGSTQTELIANNPNTYVGTSPLGFPVFIHIQDCFSGAVGGPDPNNQVGLLYSGWAQPDVGYGVTTPNGLVPQVTSNPNVDILAPVTPTFNYGKYIIDNVIEYSGGGTSTSTPYVSATAALMLSANSCLTVDEVDQLIKLSSKDVEVLPMNVNFQGQIGAGALNTGDAVELVNEMKKPDGNAVIDFHVFKRFDFDIERINNRLLIDHIVFSDNCTSIFKAKNNIEVTESEFVPNSSGYVDLSIDPGITVCPFTSRPQGTSLFKSIPKPSTKTNFFRLYPNPSKDSFTIQNMDGADSKAVAEVMDALGKIVYSAEFEGSILNINASAWSVGIYFVKIISNWRNETIKFIKQ